MIYKCYYRVKTSDFEFTFDKKFLVDVDLFFVESLDELKSIFEESAYELVYAKEVINNEDIDEFRYKFGRPSVLAQ